MKFGLFFLLLCAFILAMDIPVKKFKKPRHRKTFRLQQSQSAVVTLEMPYIPLELFIEIFVFIFGMNSLKRTFVDPMLPYKLVSWSWYDYCKSDQFQSTMMSHPRMALLKLRMSYDLDRPENMGLLHACKDLINVETSRKLILKAKSPGPFEQLWVVPIFRSTGLSKRAYKRILINAVNKGIIGRPLVPPITKSFEDDPRLAIEANLETIVAEPNLIADQLKLTQILKLAYFDDIHRPDELTFPFQLINHQVTLAYHTGRQDAVQHILDGTRLVFLPHRTENILYVCMEYSAFIAAYIGDRAFLQFINLDYEAIVSFSGELVKEDRQFVGALESVQSGQMDVFPVDMLPAVKELLDCHFFDSQLGFDVERILARSQEILDDISVKDEIKEIVLHHLFEGLRDI